MATNTAPPERRRDLRVNWRSPVRCLLLRGEAKRPLSAETENVSVVGALLLLREPLERGDTLVVDLRSEEPPLSVRRLGSVVRVEGPFADGRRRAAVDFESLSPQGRAELAAFLIVLGACQARCAPPP